MEKGADGQPAGRPGHSSIFKGERVEISPDFQPLSESVTTYLLMRVVHCGRLGLHLVEAAVVSPGGGRGRGGRRGVHPRGVGLGRMEPVRGRVPRVGVRRGVRRGRRRGQQVRVRGRRRRRVVRVVRVVVGWMVGPGRRRRLRVVKVVGDRRRVVEAGRRLEHPGDVSGVDAAHGTGAGSGAGREQAGQVPGVDSTLKRSIEIVLNFGMLQNAIAPIDRQVHRLSTMTY